MRVPVIGLAALVLFAACDEKTASAPEYDASTFYQTTSFSLASRDGHAFSADDTKLLITSDASGVFNAYTLAIGDAKQEPLTQSTTNAVSAVSFFPDDGRILYAFDQGGDERTHVYVRDADGSSQDLTPAPKAKSSFVGWRADGSAFYIASNERDGRNPDLYVYDTRTLERRLVYSNGGGFEISAVSGDGKLALIERRITSADKDLYLTDLTAPETAPRLITNEAIVALHVGQGFTPEGDKVVYTTDEHGEFTQAWTYEIATGKTEPLLTANWDVSSVSYSPKGTYQVSSIAEEGSSRTTIVNRKTNQPVDLSKLPKGGIGGIAFSDDEAKMAFTLNGDTIPSDIYVLDLATGKYAKLTQALTSKIDATQLVESEIVRFKSYDGLEIPGLLYRPRGASEDHKVPAIVSIHGGPGLQSRQGYQADLQHLLNHGYAVYRINNRGSSGYGKTFLNMDNRKHGDVDLRDVIASKDYLASIPWIDANRIAVMGGSYGGYLTAAATTFYPDTFDAAIDIFGPTNWTRTLTELPPWWQAIKESIYSEMGDPATDSERHYKISPLFHAQRIKKPLLVVQGANDPRVLQVESDELVAKVRANNVPVEYLLFPDEGHGFRKRENRIKASEAYLAFLDKHLKGKP